MAFSFNPGQTTQGDQSQGIAPSVPVGTAPDPSSLPAVPDSPFLFIQQRDRDKSVWAYVQIGLALIAGLSVIASLTLFAYSFYLSSSIAAKKEQLDTKEATFKDYPIAEMRPFSERLSQLNTLLQGYVSIRSPLRLLEDIVEQQVVFNSFTISRQKTGGYIASFTAVTSDYQSLIQQLEALKLTQYNKIAPEAKFGALKEDKNRVLKVEISTPVFVQGVLPDEIVFVPSSGNSTSTQATQPPVSSNVTIGTATTTP